MSKSYKELYNDLIGKRFKTIIISYNPIIKNYQYNGYSHKVEDRALDNLSELIIDNMIFYAFSENEILALNNNMQILDDLRDAAKYAYVERLPKRLYAKTDGTAGEVLLDIFIQLASSNAKKLIARAKHTEMNIKKEITGYDALYFTIEESEICLWLGQAKAGQKGYCKKSIIEDLQNKYKKDYFADTAFYIADRNEAKELEDLLQQINKICFLAQRQKWDGNQKINRLIELLKDKNVKIKIPCLISYTQDIYNDKNNLEWYISQEIKGLSDEFDVKTFPIELGLVCEIVFYIMPVRDVDYIRKKIIELKKDAV